MALASRIDSAEVASRIKLLKENLNSVIRGKDQVIDFIIMALIAGEDEVTSPNLPNPSQDS